MSELLTEPHIRSYLRSLWKLQTHIRNRNNTANIENDEIVIFKTIKYNSLLTCHIYFSMCTQSRDLECCCTDVQSRIFCCHFRDDKRCCVVMHNGFGFFWQVSVGSMFSPCDNRRRETFNAAGQIQMITIFDCCISSDHRFLHNLKEKISKKISVCLTNC